MKWTVVTQASFLIVQSAYVLTRRETVLGQQYRVLDIHWTGKNVFVADLPG